MAAKIKRLLVFLTCLLCLSLTCFVIGCTIGGDDNTGTNSTQKFSLEKKAIGLEVGATYALTVKCEDYDGEIEWYSYNSNIAVVDGNGVVSGLSEGRTVIVVTAGEFSDSCEVVVTASEVETMNLSLEISSTAIVLNADSQFNTSSLSVDAYYNGVGISADEVEWSSTNTSAVALDKTTGKTVTVTGLLNDASANVTAKIVYKGITATVTCKVVTEKFAYIIPKQEKIVLFSGEDKSVDFDLYVAGELSTAEKTNAKFTSSNPAVVEVDQAGNLTAGASGTAEITISYGTKTATVQIEVGSTKYISTASQFLAIDGASKLNKFILNADIDLSEYYNGLEGVGVKYFINSFGGTLIGNGHTVYGLNRYAIASDSGFDGIFNSIQDTAVIQGVKFISDIDTNQTATLIASINNGSLENCIFEVTANSGLYNYALFGVNVGKIDKCAFVLNCNSTAETQIIVASTGYAKFSDSSIIAPKLTGSTSVNGATSTSVYFTNTYYYESVAGFENGVANGITDNGNGGRVASEALGDTNPANYGVANGKVLFEGKPAVNYSFSREIAQPFAKVETFGNTVPLNLPSKTGSNVQIFDKNFNDVTDTTYVDGGFTAEYPGDYTILYTSSDNGNVTGNVYSIRIIKSKLELDKNIFTLSPSASAQITANGQALDSNLYDFIISDASIATVDATGTITAVSTGEVTIKVVGKNTIEEYFVAVRVQNEYITVSTAEELVDALNTATKDTYIVMANDITIASDSGLITYKPYYDASDVLKTYFVFIAEKFSGTLDGQGHKLSLYVDNVNHRLSGLSATIGDDICGLFYELTETSVVKNLNYYYESVFKPNGGSQVSSYTSALTMYLKGEVRDCYLKAKFNPTSAINGAEALIGIMLNTSSSASTAYCYNVLFDITTVVNGERVESGYAIRRGTSSPYAIDCAIIRNGSLKEFFGDFNNHASVVLGNNNNCYNTVYDFVNGLNGYRYTTSYTSIRIPDGVKTYSAWSNKWSFNFDEILLCGKKIADVNYESSIVSEGSGMYAGVFYWDSPSAAEIFIDGKLVGVTSDGKFDIYGYLQSIDATVGNYEVLVTDGEVATCVIFEIVGLTNANFKSTINGANSFEKTQYKYYVLTEDVTMDMTKTLGDQYLYGNYYMFNKVYTNIDGRGYSITVDLENTYGGKLFGGFIYELYAELQNVQLNFNVKYLTESNGGVRNYLAETIKCGGLNNVVFKINATVLNANGVVVKDEIKTPTICGEIIGQYNGIKNSTGVCENVIVIHNGLNTFKFTSKTNLGIRFKNVAVVSSAYATKLADTNNFVTNSCYLTDVNTLIYGGSAKLIGENDNGLSDGAYEFSNMFSQSNFIVNGNELLLCGKKVLVIVDLGDDTFVSDSDLI